MSLLSQASLCVTPNAYKEGKLYSVIPSDGSGDLSVTRATTATRVNSAGLVELVPYNLIWYSEQFDNLSHWGLYQVSVTANSTTAPNGTNTADTITDSSTFGYPYQSVSLSNGVGSIVTFSVFLKRTNNDWVNVAASRTPGTTYGEFGVWFNLATGAIGSNFQAGVGVVVDSEITDEGDGWYRCSVTGYVTNAVGYVPYVFNSNADNSFTSSSGKSRYQWGAQLVEGSVAKDYQKTETRLNIPRLDYSNGTCPSLLVEPQRTNEASYSEQFDNSWWTKYEATVTENNTTAPNGATSADKLTDNTANDGHFFYRVLTISSALTMSVYAKAAEYTKVAIRNLSDGGDVIFDLSNGTIVSTPSNFTNAQIESLDNGWYRISATTNGTSGTKAMGYSLVNNSNQTTFVGTGTSSAYFWGAQLEVGSYATSYIPTTSASVTRNADVISKTGISSLIGQTEGTLFAEIDWVNNGNDVVFSTISDGTTSNRIHFGYAASGNSWYLYVESGGASQVNITLAAPTNGKYRLAVAYKLNDYAFYVNGVQIGTDTSATVPSTSQLNVGGFITTGLEYSNNATALWKTRLTNDQLATLTTI